MKHNKMRYAVFPFILVKLMTENVMQLLQDNTTRLTMQTSQIPLQSATNDHFMKIYQRNPLKCKESNQNINDWYLILCRCWSGGKRREERKRMKWGKKIKHVSPSYDN